MNWNWKVVTLTGIRFLTSAGVGEVVKNAIVATTPKSASIMSKVLVGVGGFAISAMIGDMVSDYVIKQIEDVIKPTPIEEPKGE